MLLYIIRHGDPDYTTDSLTGRGALQAEAVGRRMRDAGIDRIFSSPMGRALETAQAAARLTGLDVQIEDWTHEVGDERMTYYPDGRRKSISNVQNTCFRENGNMDLPYDRAYECPGIDDTAMRQAVAYIQEQGRGFLERLGYREEGGVYRILRPNEEKIALFCHGVFSRAWISTLLHIPLHIMWAGMDYTHTGVTVLEFRNNDNGVTAPKCLCYSDISHLYASGLDTRYNNRMSI